MFHEDAAKSPCTGTRRVGQPGDRTAESESRHVLDETCWPRDSDRGPRTKDHGLSVSNPRQPQPLAQEAIDTRVKRLLIRRRGHSFAERLEIRGRVMSQRRLQLGGTTVTHRRTERAIKVGKIVDEACSRGASGLRGHIADFLEPVERPQDLALELGRGWVRLARHEAPDNAVKMRDEAAATLRRQRGIARRRVGSAPFKVGRQRNADCSTPRIERVKDIGLAEVNPHRMSARPSRVVPLEAAVDAVENKFNGDAARRPAGHKLEGRSHDSNEVAIVLATQVGFDVAAVLIGVHALVAELP